VDTSFEGVTVAEATPGVPEIFGEALEIESAEERLAFLRQACGGDARRRAEVETLLSAHAAAGAFLEAPAASGAGGAAATTSDIDLDPPECSFRPAR
jgi:hypothetical protein